MNFLDLALQGVEKSNQAKAVIKEVSDVFEDVNRDLGAFPNYDLKLDRAQSIVNTVARAANFFQKNESEYFDDDILRLTVCLNDIKFSETVSFWRQHKEGYPCALRFDGQEFICQNKTQLISGIGELLSSIGFGNVLNSLIKKVERSLPKKGGPS